MASRRLCRRVAMLSIRPIKTQLQFQLMKITLKYFTFCCVLAVCLQSTGTPLAVGHGKLSQTTKPKTYRNVRGQIVAVLKPKKAGEKTAITLDHEKIPNFMRAMRMTIPLQNPADSKKLKKGVKISFDLVLKRGNFLVANIRLLSPKTKLNLAPH